MHGNYVNWIRRCSIGLLPSLVLFNARFAIKFRASVFVFITVCPFLCSGITLFASSSFYTSFLLFFLSFFRQESFSLFYFTYSSLLLLSQRSSPVVAATQFRSPALNHRKAVTDLNLSLAIPPPHLSERLRERADMRQPRTRRRTRGSRRHEISDRRKGESGEKKVRGTKKKGNNKNGQSQLRHARLTLDNRR